MQLENTQLENTQLEATQTKVSTRIEIARWISTIVHPIAFPLLTLAIATFYATHNSLVDAVRYTVLALLLTSLPISALVSIQVMRRKWTDLDVSVRSQRFTLYPFGILCMGALTLAFAHFGAPAIAVRAAAAFGIVNIINGLINLFYKVSAHASGAAACAAIFWVGVPLWGLSLTATFAALLVGWSRVELKRHTRGQVMLGWAMGVFGVFLAMRLPIPTSI